MGKKRAFFSLFFCAFMFAALGVRADVKSHYPLLVEKIIFYKKDNFKVFYGGPIERTNGAAHWMISMAFEDSSYRTRAAYEAAFINCNIDDAKDADIIFATASDSNMKFKNVLSEEHQAFNSLLDGEYPAKRYILVRHADVAHNFYPDIHVSSVYGKQQEEDKKRIAQFFHEQFETRNGYTDWSRQEDQEEVDFETEEEISYKERPIEIEFAGKKVRFSSIKRVLKNDEWKVYYILSNRASIKDLRDSLTPILVRIDSGCVSGQIYDDMTCDCLEQLHEGLHKIAMNKEEKNVLIHIPAHDGRGLGTALKAETEIYKRGGRGRVHETEPLDTVQAAKLLYGSQPYDIRTYDGAAEILKSLGITKVSLLTDNMIKVETLERHGIHVFRRKTETEKQSCLKHTQAKKKSEFYYASS